MKYPVINGEIPPMAVVSEYHVVNARGMVIHIFDNYALAKQRFESFGIGCHLVQVSKHLTVLDTKRPNPLTKSAALKLVAEREGIPVIDVKMSA